MAAAETSPDLSSVLSHVNSLESEKKQMQEYLAKQNERIERLTMAKRQEMKTQLDGLISGWINGIDVTDETVKKDFISGLENIVRETKEDSPIWNLMVCASASHNRNVNQLQKVQEDYNALKTRVEGGTFHTEEARVGSKRKEPEEQTRGGGGNVWDDFEASLRGGGVSNYTPDPGALKALRQEWTPIS